MYTGVDISRRVKDDRTVILVHKNGKCVKEAEIPRVRMQGDWLLVFLNPDPIDKVSKGGIIIPQTSHDNILRTGWVVATGPGCWAHKPYLKDGEFFEDVPAGVKITGPKYQRIPLGVEVGEKVLFIKFAVTHTETAKRVQQIVGRDFGMIQPKDILLAGEDVDKVVSV